MRSLFLIFAFSYAVLALIPFHQSAKEDRVENEYIFALQYNLDENVKTDYEAKIVSQGGVILNKYKIGKKLELYHVQMTSELVAEHLKESAILRYIEENQVVGLAEQQQSCGLQNPSIWNLERVSERQIDLSDKKGYTYESKSGEGVTSYIIDTGIRTTHNEFKGRATWGTNTVDGTDTDCNGHGTHVAGTVGGTLYGVAKKVTLVAVKVLNCGGSGTINSVVGGIDWVTKNQAKPANANMSLGGGNSAAIVEAVEASSEAGVIYVVAAGNSNANACSYSPANAPSAITVGATTIEGENGVQEDVRSYFSNYGPCCDIFAPGQLITSAWIGSDDATNEISGTSMASPHVAGAVSILQADNANLSPAEAVALLDGAATRDTIDLACNGVTACLNSPNLLLYSSCST